MSNKGVNISIMGRDFAVACPDDERESLMSAARYLDNSMKEIQKTGKIIGAERCAIMAALNITNDLLKLQHSTMDQSRVEAKLNTLQERVDDVLREAENM